MRSASIGCPESSACQLRIDKMALSLPSFRDEVRSATVLQWNARGLKSRISCFRQYVFRNRFPILVICEPNLSKAIKLSGYEAFTSSTCGEPSKVIIYIRTDLTYIPRLVQPHNKNQYVCLRVANKKVAFTLIGAYIPQSGMFDGERLHDI